MTKSNHGLKTNKTNACTRDEMPIKETRKQRRERRKKEEEALAWDYSPSRIEKLLKMKKRYAILAFICFILTIAFAAIPILMPFCWIPVILCVWYDLQAFDNHELREMLIAASTGLKHPTNYTTPNTGDSSYDDKGKGNSFEQDLSHVPTTVAPNFSRMCDINPVVGSDDHPLGAEKGDYCLQVWRRIPAVKRLVAYMVRVFKKVEDLITLLMVDIPISIQKLLNLHD